MIALSIASLPFPAWPRRSAKTKTDNSVRITDHERRRIVGEMISAGACESEYGVQMLMSVFPERF